MVKLRHYCPHAVLTLSQVTSWQHYLRSNHPLWLWDGTFATTTSLVPGTSMTTQSVVSIKVHGHFIELVNPAIIAPSEHLGAEQREHIFNDSTWALSEVALQTAVAALWTKLDESKISLNAAALIGSTTSVPYKTAYGTSWITSSNGITY